MLEIEGVRKSFGTHEVLRGVDLEVRAGQVLGLVGANGAGKSTLIAIANGLLLADSGSVRIEGLDIRADRRRAAEHLGLAPQDLGLYPTLTARANLEILGRLCGLSRRMLRRRVDEVAEALDLLPCLARRADELSGGQKRRLHTAMAVLHRPSVLFLDEPTVGADVPSRARILQLVRQLAIDGTAVVYTTHYLPELEELTADIAVLDRGRIVESGPVDELVLRYGATGVSLVFAGAPPTLAGWRASGTTLSPDRPVSDPAAAAAAAAAALRDLGALTSGLQRIDVSRPSLESAYLAITRTTSRSEPRDVVPA